MVELPNDIWLEIFSYLPQRHLRLVAQTCRSLATLSKSLIFSTLVLHGDCQKDRYYSENGVINVLYPGRSKSVELSSLEATVDELISLDIPRHVKRLEFGPRVYADGFWVRYRQWVIDQIDEEIEIDYFDEEEDFDDDEDEDEFGYIGARRIMEERRSKSERESSAVEAAERTWAAKVQEQNSKMDANRAALIRLFQHMPRLTQLILTQWDCNFQEHGLEEISSDQCAEIFPHDKTTWANLTMLSSSLEASHTRLRHLTLPAIDPLFTATDTSLEALFKTVTSLSFNIKDLTFMTATSNQNASTFLKLIQCASETLRKLDFRNHTESHPQLPETDEHFLEKLFQDPESDPPGGLRPLPFPRLTTLKLRSIILNTPSLIAFLSRLPVLEYAEFEYIYLATIGYRWSDVAKALPSTCQKFSISYCGHERYGPQSPFAYNHIIEFKPYQKPFPVGTGWQANDAPFHREWNNMVRLVAMGCAPPYCVGLPHTYLGKGKEQWIKDQRGVQWSQAEFERI